MRVMALLCLFIASWTAEAQDLVKLKAGMVTGIDQIGLPIALERGFFEKYGLDVEIARPYATGVDALNALLEKAGLGPNDVTLVNTPPPDMTVALLSKGIDAFSCWDPWTIVALKDVPGAVEIIRGGDVISYLGFNVALRPWVEKNGPTIEKFLAALSEADKWMRANPKQAAQTATRWIPGLKPDVAEAAMQFNIQQADRGLSENNYR